MKTFQEFIDECVISESDSSHMTFSKSIPHTRSHAVGTVPGFGPDKGRASTNSSISSKHVGAAINHLQSHGFSGHTLSGGYGETHVLKHPDGRSVSIPRESGSSTSTVSVIH